MRAILFIGAVACFETAIDSILIGLGEKPQVVFPDELIEAWYIVATGFLWVMIRLIIEGCTYDKETK